MLIFHKNNGVWSQDEKLTKVIHQQMLNTPNQQNYFHVVCQIGNFTQLINLRDNRFSDMVVNSL